MSTVLTRGLPCGLYSWGESEWAIITTGEVMIDYEHITDAARPTITLGNAPCCGDERFEGFKALAAAAKANGALMIAQVCHPGRSVRAAWVEEAISASASTQGTEEHHARHAACWSGQAGQQRRSAT